MSEYDGPYPWQLVFMHVATRAFGAAVSRYRSAGARNRKLPTTADLSSSFAEGIRQAWETTIRDWLFQELVLSRDANGLYVGPKDDKPRSWEFLQELPYLGRGRNGKRVDIALIRFVSELSETADGHPTFWCGVELKRGAHGRNPLKKDIEKIQSRHPRSIVETFNLLVWGLKGRSDDDDARSFLQEEAAKGRLRGVQWSWVPLGAQGGVEAPTAPTEWLWICFAEVVNSHEFDDPNEKKARLDARRKLFDLWHGSNAADYYGGQWIPLEPRPSDLLEDDTPAI